MDLKLKKHTTTDLLNEMVSIWWENIQGLLAFKKIDFVYHLIIPLILLKLSIEFYRAFRIEYEHFH